MKRKRSNLWNFFDAVDKESKMAKCNVCYLKFSYKTSTSNLKKHMKNKHPLVTLETDEDIKVSFD